LDDQAHVTARHTAIHRLNADRPLSAIGKASYFTLNWLNNALPYWFVDPKLAVRDFACPPIEAHRAELPHGASPSRTLSDLFWLSLPWPAMRDELGPIHILDIGCGSGGYGPRLLSWAAGAIASYTGTDARPHADWPALEARDSRLRFFTSRAERFADHIPPGTNLFISQSAIEHFDDDLGFFEQIRDYLRTTPGPALQIHLVPSQACLRLYQLHGVRQYTPRTISKITRLFGAETYAALYGLGGGAANRVHYEYITKPLLILKRGDRRSAQPDDYQRALFTAIASDGARPQPSPAFWALVLHSRWQTRLFS
jgi:SAM-dependent methyltransferase